MMMVDCAALVTRLPVAPPPTWDIPAMPRAPREWAAAASYFRPAMQALLRFLDDRRLRQRAEELTGYDPSPAGQIRFAA